MSPRIAIRPRSPARALASSLLAALVLALAACGGGGGGGGGDAGGGANPPPPPTDPTTPAGGTLALADCLQVPTGVTNTYLNSSRPRREHRAATFLGEAVVARLEFANATAATPVRVLYFRADPAARTFATVGREDLNAGGTVTLREQLVGLAHSTALAPGASETVSYTVRTLVPSGVPERTERMTVTYDGNVVVTLPDPAAGASGLGRLDTCRLRQTIETVAGATATPVSVETLHHAPGLGLVKSYYKPTLASFIDVNQTYLTELSATTGTLALRPATADAAPTLALCSVLAPGLQMEFTASGPDEAGSAFRRTSQSSFNGVPAIAIDRLRAATRTRAQTNYVDPNVGFLLHVGVESWDSSGNVLVTRRSRTGRPDLRPTPPLATVNFVETFTLIGAGNTPPVTSSDSFRFDGFAKVITPAGAFDTCKVTFRYGSDGSQETYYHAPNFHWVRLETVFADGTRTSRELIAR